MTSDSVNGDCIVTSWLRLKDFFDEKFLVESFQSFDNRVSEKFFEKLFFL